MQVGKYLFYFFLFGLYCQTGKLVLRKRSVEIAVSYTHLDVYKRQRYDRTDDNANAPINHATERSRMQRVVRNLLLDPMCEENSSVWEKSSTGTITRDQSTRQFGLVSYRLTIWSSDCVYVRQAVTLTPGKSYTLSGYVRSGGPRGVMRVVYTVCLLYTSRCV